MKFKATSYGVNLGPNEGTTKPWQVFCSSAMDGELAGQEFLKGLTAKQQAKAYVKVVEIKEVLVAEIHTAAERAEDGQLIFAIARP